jgi:hypothetical protein
MKIPSSSAPFITLVMMTLALAAACTTTPTTNSNGAASSNTANASNARPAATATPATAATSSSLSTPTKTFMAFYEASKNKNVPAVMGTLSKDSVDFLTAEAKKENKTLEAALTESLKTSDVPATAPETRNEKIDGDKATLEVKDDKVADKWDTFNFVKENGEWKLKLGIE